MKSNFEFENLMQLLAEIKMDDKGDTGKNADAAGTYHSAEPAPRAKRQWSARPEPALPIMPLTVAELRCMKRIKGIGQLKDENFKIQRVLFLQRE